VTPDPDADSKPANEVTPDPAAPSADLAEPHPAGRSPSASACEPYRELIELALARGRNAKAIWQDLVDDHSFSGDYQSVKRFVRKLRGSASPPARAVILTAPGEDYGESGIMLSVAAAPAHTQRGQHPFAAPNLP
jgi:transposase